MPVLPSVAKRPLVVANGALPVAAGSTSVDRLRSPYGTPVDAGPPRSAKENPVPPAKGLAFAGLVLIVVAAACRESVTDPVEQIPLRPSSFASGPEGSCRVWYDGSATKWIAPSTWSGPCPTAVTVTSSRAWLGSTNPDSVVYVFQNPVGDISSGVVYSCPGLCPAIQMSVSAYGVDGSTILDHVPFSNGGGVNYSFQLFNLGSPVKRPVIYAPSPLPPDQTGDRAISWSFDIGLLCPPTGDQALEDAGVRQALLDALAASNPSDPDPAQSKEQGGIIWRMPDGTFVAEPVVDPNATGCSYKAANGTFTPPPGAVPYADYHAHPNSKNRLQTHASYPSQLQPNETGFSDPDFNGGAGKNDWNGATQSGYPTYVISVSGTVSRLDPGVDATQQPNNHNRWTWDKTGLSKCFKSMFA